MELTQEIKDRIWEIVHARCSQVEDASEMEKYMFQCLCRDYVDGISIPEMEE